MNFLLAESWLKGLHLRQTETLRAVLVDHPHCFFHVVDCMRRRQWPMLFQVAGTSKHAVHSTDRIGPQFFHLVDVVLRRFRPMCGQFGKSVAHHRRVQDVGLCRD